MGDHSRPGVVSSSLPTPPPHQFLSTGSSLLSPLSSISSPWTLAPKSLPGYDLDDSHFTDQALTSRISSLITERRFLLKKQLQRKLKSLQSSLNEKKRIETTTIANGNEVIRRRDAIEKLKFDILAAVMDVNDAVKRLKEVDSIGHMAGEKVRGLTSGDVRRVREERHVVLPPVQEGKRVKAQAASSTSPKMEGKPRAAEATFWGVKRSERDSETSVKEQEKKASKIYRHGRDTSFEKESYADEDFGTSRVPYIGGRMNAERLRSRNRARDYRPSQNTVAQGPFRKQSGATKESKSVVVEKSRILATDMEDTFQSRTCYGSKPIDIYRAPIAPWKHQVTSTLRDWTRWAPSAVNVFGREFEAKGYAYGYNTYRADSGSTFVGMEGIVVPSSSSSEDRMEKAQVIGFQRRTSHMFRKYSTNVGLKTCKEFSKDRREDPGFFVQRF